LCPWKFFCELMMPPPGAALNEVFFGSFSESVLPSSAQYFHWRLSTLSFLFLSLFLVDDPITESSGHTNSKRSWWTLVCGPDPPAGFGLFCIYKGPLPFRGFLFECFSLFPIFGNCTEFLTGSVLPPFSWRLIPPICQVPIFLPIPPAALACPLFFSVSFFLQVKKSLAAHSFFFSKIGLFPFCIFLLLSERFFALYPIQSCLVAPCSSFYFFPFLP